MNFTGGFKNRLMGLNNPVKTKSNIQIFDGKDLMVEGCSGVLEVDDNLIRLRLYKSHLSITGFKLELSNFGADGIIIRGDIHSLEFDKGKRGESLA